MAGEKPKFRYEGDVYRWIEGQPKEVAVAMTARMAMRALPALGGSVEQGEDKAPMPGLLPVFRAMATPWVDARCPTQGVGRAAADAANSVFDAADSVFDAADAALEAPDTSRAVAFAVARAAFAAAMAAIAARAATVAAADDDAAAVYAHDAAGYAATAYTAADAAAAATVYSAVATDAAFFLLEEDSEALVSRPLWLDGAPEWSQLSWSSLKAWLLAREGENWQVWTDWYDARLRGDPVDCELEVARVTELTEEDWADPVRANAKIAAIEARFATGDDSESEAEDTPRGPAPYRFGFSNGRLNAAPLKPVSDNPGLMQQLLAGALRRAEAYAQRMAESNAPAAVQANAEDIRDLLRDWAEAPLAVPLWHAQQDILGIRAEYDAEALRMELPENAFALMDALNRSLEPLLGLYPDIRDIRAAIALQQMTPEMAARFEAPVQALTSALEATEELVTPQAIEALNTRRDVVDAATAQVEIDPGAADVLEKAAEASAERTLVVSDMIYELIEEAEAWVEAQEAAPSDGHSDAPGLGEDAPYTWREFREKIVRHGQDWALKRADTVLDATTFGSPIIILLLCQQYLAAAVLAVPYLSRYREALDALTKFINAFFKDQ